MSTVASLCEVLSIFLEPRHVLESRALTRTLRPGHGDFEAVFVDEVAERARIGYAALWRLEPFLATAPGETLRDVTLVDSAELAETALSIPGGFRVYAWAFRPGVVWASWRFGRRLHAGMAFTAGRWRWFPRPWRFIESALLWAE